MEVIPNEEKMPKDIDKLYKILKLMFTKDQERRNATDISDDGINTCKLAEKLAHSALKFTNKVFMALVPNFKTMFGGESTRLQKLEETLKFIKSPLMAI